MLYVLMKGLGNEKTVEGKRTKTNRRRSRVLCAPSRELAVTIVPGHVDLSSESEDSLFIAWMR